MHVSLKMGVEGWGRGWRGGGMGWRDGLEEWVGVMGWSNRLEGWGLRGGGGGWEMRMEGMKDWREGRMEGGEGGGVARRKKGLRKYIATVDFKPLRLLQVPRVKQFINLKSAIWGIKGEACL
jgi:hypothetical protein